MREPLILRSRLRAMTCCWLLCDVRGKIRFWCLHVAWLSWRCLQHAKPQVWVVVPIILDLPATMLHFRLHFSPAWWGFAAYNQLKVAYTMFACATLLASSCLDFSGLSLALQRSFRVRPERGGFGSWILHSALDPLLLHLFLYLYFLGVINSSLWVRCFVSDSLMEVVVETPWRHPNNLLAKNKTLSLPFWKCLDRLIWRIPFMHEYI